MIRPTDAFVLAYTKLRTHKVRTGITIGVAGIMFGLILAIIFVVQGVFDSVARFSKEGLSDRSIVIISNMSVSSYNAYEHTDDKDFVAEVEALHKKTVDKKEAAAKKYNIDYNAAIEDPSPIVIDAKSKRKIIPDDNMGNPFVLQAVRNHDSQDKDSKFDVNKYIGSYGSAKVLTDYYQVAPTDGELKYMENGKDPSLKKQKLDLSGPSSSYDSTNIQDLNPTVINGAVTSPFVTDKNFDAQKGEIPVVVPYGAAAKLLGLEKLDKDATSKQRLDRLNEVRNRINDVKIDYCYRNQASQQLLSTAIQEVERLKELKNSPTVEFASPSLEYKLPSGTACGPVKIKRDSRTAQEKQQAENQKKYEKAIGTYIGNPEQRKITFRGVGIVGDMGGSGTETQISDIVMLTLGSNLGWGTLPIPADLLEQVTEKYRPTNLFGGGELNKIEHGASAAARLTEQSYLVEFGDKNEARDLLKKLEGSTKVYVTQFGSSSLIIDEFKTFFTKAILWSLLGMCGVAVIILGSMIGRTVSEGRRESAVFRAIGAKRIDIAAIYSSYAFLLSLRVVLFSVALGAVIAFVADILTTESATVGARLAYAARDINLEFHIFSVVSWYVLVVIGVVILAGVLGSVIPIIRSVRRNPINDMRDE